MDITLQILVIWQSGFREEDFQKSTNQKQELPVAAKFVNGSGRNEQSLQRTCHSCILPSFGSFGKAVLEEKIFQKSSNQKQELSMVAIFVNGSGQNEQSQQRTFHRCFLPSFSSFGQTVSEEKNLIFSIVFYFLLFFSLIFKFEKRQRPCLMAVGIIIHGLKENYICIVPLQFGSNIGCLQYLKN